MKTKTFLLLCLFFGIGLSQLSAQNIGDDNKATKDLRVWTDYQFVNCDGELVMLTGTVYFIGIKHASKKVGMRYIFHLRGELTSSDGEVFKLLQNDINDDIGGDVHFNLIGDRGSHYIGSVTFVDWNPVVTKIICLENGKK
jgi:hypothetical protein